MLVNKIFFEPNYFIFVLIINKVQILIIYVKKYIKWTNIFILQFECKTTNCDLTEIEDVKWTIEGIYY